MEESKGQAIFLSVIGVSTLLVAIVGATFAWFSITVEGNDEAQNMIFTTANLGVVSFNDGAEIDASGIMPGTKLTKTFTVGQSDPEATSDIEYVIKLNVRQNTLTPVAEEQFVHTLTSSGNTNNGTLITLDQAVVPTETIILGTGTLKGYETHTYDYTIEFKNLDRNQNAAQGKTFGGYISVELIQPTPEQKSE